MPRQTGIDELDARLIDLFSDQPSIGVLGASRALGVARGTVQARLDRLQASGVIASLAPEVKMTSPCHPSADFTRSRASSSRLRALRPSA